jgi:hypothetical protein
MIHFTTQHTALNVSVVSIIHALNAAELPELARLLLQNPRFAGVCYQAVVPTLGMEWREAFFDEDPLWPREPEKLGAVLDALDRLEALQSETGRIHNERSQWGFWRRYFRDPRGFLAGQGCRVGDSMLHMTAEGRLRFCHHFPHLGLAGVVDPRELWPSARAQELRRELHACARPCNYKVNCCFDLESGG